MDGFRSVHSLHRSRFRPGMSPFPGVARWLCACCLMLMAAPLSVAQEPVIPFIQGLRERGYFDTALEYLEIQASRTDLPTDVRELLDLERAITCHKAAAASRVPEDREQLLGNAEAALAKFLAEQAAHPQAAFAGSLLGELKFERARSLIWKANDAESPQTRGELQAQARALIDDAQGIYQTSRDQFFRQFKAFPGFIEKDDEEYAKRAEVESRYLRAWFQLVRCTYERGQTYDQGSEDRKQTLISAAKLFEEIHTSYRTNPIGLHARLMMARCFQDQGDLGRALGLYNELIDHKSERATVELVQASATHFRLTCLNDPQKNDHQLVIQEASRWLESNRKLATTEAGLGILWEKAIAQEHLSSARDLEDSNRESLLRATLNDATTVSKYEGPFREPANAMVRRLKLALGDKDREPKDFDTAFERARGMVNQIAEMTDAIAEATDEPVKTQQQTLLDNHLNEVGRLLRLALDLKTGDSDPKAVAQSRYLLSFVLLRQGRPYDAVLLSSYCMEHDRADDPDTAINATEVAMAACVAAWNQAPARERDFETRLLRDVCRRILELYPQSSRAGEARMRLGSVYRTMNQPLEASTWYLQVPETDPQYALARISAGQSYWAAWTGKTALAAEDTGATQTSPEDLQTWKAEARNLLTQGIQLTRQKLGPNAPPTEDLVKAEVSLASIQNLDGEFTQTIERLTAGGENSIIAAISVPDGAVRPEDGPTSAGLAGLTLRLLLRAYVGVQQIDQALATMTQLEKVGGQDILGAYTQLGLELQEELKRLNVSGEAERLAQTRDSFEKFLTKVYESRDKSDFNSLLWIGETYYGLGQGVAGDPSAAAAYYSRAADAFSEIRTGGLAKDANVNAVNLRLARCRRAQQQYDDAFRICDEILQRNPNILDAQFEAALALADWGAEKDPAKLLDSIRGVKDGAGQQHVWGWSRLARQLQQATARDPAPELWSRFLDARYELSNSRRRYARVAQDKSDGTAQIKAGMAEIVSMVQAFRNLDDIAFSRFDRLYQDLQADQGIAAVPLERAAVIAPPSVVAESSTQKKPPETAAPEAAASTSTPPGGSGWLLPVLTSSLFIGLAGGAFVLLRRPKQRVRIPGSAAAPKLSGVAVPEISANAAALPPDLNFAPAAEPEFAAFAGFAGAATRKPASTKPEGQSSKSGGAKPVQRPVQKTASADAGSGAPPGDVSAAPRPKPRPSPGTPAEPAPPRPAATARPSGEGVTTPAQSPASRPAATRPRSQAPGEATGSAPPVRPAAKSAAPGQGMPTPRPPKPPGAAGNQPANGGGPPGSSTSGADGTPAQPRPRPKPKPPESTPDAPAGGKP